MISDHFNKDRTIEERLVREPVVSKLMSKKPVASEEMNQDPRLEIPMSDESCWLKSQ